MTFSDALEALRAGDLRRGLELLEAAHREDPDNPELLGHLAWAVLSAGDFDRAERHYRALAMLQPDNAEVRFRLAQVALRREGRLTRRRVRALLEAAEQARRRELFVELLALCHEAGRQDFAAAVATAAIGLFPGDSQFQVIHAESRRLAKRGALRSFGRKLGLKSLVEYLASTETFRRAAQRSASSTAEHLTFCLEDFYRAGSVDATFPQSDPAMRPETFDAHMKECTCPWIRWMRENMPDREPRGKTLLDVGAGPGFWGHHFAHWGYEVTALSGSDAELLECRMRGMKTMKAEMHAIPAPAQSFDAVLASHVLEHSVAPMLLLWEMRRVLRPGGILYVNLPVPIEGEPRHHFPEAYDAEDDSYRFDSNERGDCINPYLTYYAYGFPPHLFVLTYWQWRWVFRQAGFEHLTSAIDRIEGSIVPWEEAERTRPDGPVHWNQLFILRKP